MKWKHRYKVGNKIVEREYNYIPVRYRSLVHHFENGVWMYNTDCLADIKADMLDTIEKSIYIKPDSVKTNLFQRFIRSIVRIFAPLL